MNYDDMSDFEVNKAVAKVIYPDCFHLNTIGDSVFVSKSINKNCFESIVNSSFDPCNNPSDAWPIIDLIWERLMQVDNYYHAHTRWEAYCIEHDIGKLRASMICFLKMKEELNNDDT